MKYVDYFFIGIIRGYQYAISPFLRVVLGANRACRYEISCSEYSIEKIKQFGILKGSALSIKRLLSCRPFARI